MVHSIKETFHIHVNDVLVTRVDVRFGLQQGLMGIAVWSKSVTVFRKYRFPDRTQNLVDGLLDHSIYHSGYPQLPDTPARFWNSYAQCSA